MTFTVSLDNPIDIPVTVDVNYTDVSTGAGDFDHTADSVTFATLDTADKTVTVAITDDDVVEATETFTASLSISPQWQRCEAFFSGEIGVFTFGQI